MAKGLVIVDKKSEEKLKKHWPGKYTFVLNRAEGFKLYGVDKKTIALRIPKHKFLNDLLEKINKPLVQTSVNISGKPPLSKIKEIIETFDKAENQPDLIVDAGNLPKLKSSKVIDLTVSGGKVLRY